MRHTMEVETVDSGGANPAGVVQWQNISFPS